MTRRRCLWLLVVIATAGTGCASTKSIPGYKPCGVGTPIYLLPGCPHNVTWVYLTARPRIR